MSKKGCLNDSTLPLGIIRQHESVVPSTDIIIYSTKGNQMFVLWITFYGIIPTSHSPLQVCRHSHPHPFTSEHLDLTHVVIMQKSAD